VVVAGLSMGGTLSLWLAARHPEIAGIVVVNPAAAPPSAELVTMFEELVAAGTTTIPGIGNDVADPDQTELTYGETPLAQAKSLFDAVEALQDDLSRIPCPALIFTSTQDHVVSPTDSDHLAARLGGSVERVLLERSFHVATLDFDRELIERDAVAFARRVCGG
jgi:carboxylesterase